MKSHKNYNTLETLYTDSDFVQLLDESINKVLQALEKQSNLEKTRKADVAPKDRMLAITKDTGLFYNILLRSSNAKRVLEIGLSVGYSALWFIDAIAKNSGHMITIEKNPSKIQRAQINFKQAGVSKLVTIKEGDALEILEELKNNDERFDFIFIDADKENCMKYFKLAYAMLNQNGIIGTDNMSYPQKYQQEMQEYHQYISRLPNVKTMTLDIGNGQEISIKQ